MKTPIVSTYVLIILLLSGCSGKTSEEYVAMAEVKIEKNELRSAIIDLKNAVLVDANNMRARFTLGNAYLRLGLVNEAEKELSWALKLGYSPSEVLPPLTKSLSMQSKYTEIFDLINEFPDLNEEAKSTMLFYRTLSLLKSGQNIKAEQYLNETSLNPSDTKYGDLSHSYFLAVRQDLSEATEFTKSLLVKYENFDEAYLFIGQLYLLNRDYPKAVNAFSNYLRIYPEYKLGRLFLADALVKNSEYQKALEHINFLIRNDVNIAYLHQLKGIVDYQLENYAGAIEFSNSAIQGGLNNVTNNLIVGLSAFQIKNYEQAYQRLKKIQDKISVNHVARNIYIRTQMELGYTDDAVNYLNKLDNVNLGDSDLLTSMSMELINLGEFEQAGEVLGVVEQFDIQEPLVLTKLGIIRQKLRDDPSIKLLEKSLALDGSIQQTKIALVRGYISEGNQDKALDLIDQWIDNEPQNIVPLNLLSTIFLKSGELEKAEVYLNQALSISASNPLSMMYFANKDIAKGDKEAGISKIQKLLKEKPNFIEGWYTYYKIADNSKLQEHFVSLLSDAVTKQSNVELSTFYAQVLVKQNDIEKAKSEFKEIVKLKGAPEASYAMYGKILEAEDEFDEAILIYQKWRTNHSSNKKAWLTEIGLYERMSKYKKGESVSNEAVLKFPDDSRFAILNAQYKIFIGDEIGAKQILSKFEGDKNFELMSNALQAQILLENKEYAKALSGFMDYYRVRPLSKNAITIYEINKHLGHSDVGFEFLEEHLKSSPKDKMIREKLALDYLSVSPEKSVIHYSALIENEPSNTTYLNNLAWALGLVNKVDEALSHITKAYKLAPNDINVLDTYVRMLVQGDRMSEASTIVKNASRRIVENKGYGAIKELVN